MASTPERAMPFKKGQSGNPAGRKPNTKTTPELLREIGSMSYRNTPQTMRERALFALYEKACLGDLPALVFITERTEGKVPDKLEQTGDTRIVVVYEEPKKGGRD